MRLQLKFVDETGTEHWTAEGMCRLLYSPRTRRSFANHGTLGWRWRR